MATVGEVARGALAAVASGAEYPLAVQWVNERHAQLAARLRPRHLRRAGTLVVPAPTTAGLATVARGAAVVTGDATAQAAWSNALEGHFFQGRQAWYEVLDASASGLTLASPFAEDTLTAGAYRVVARYHDLPAGARHASGFTLARLWQPLREVQMEVLDQRAPGRFYSTALPMGGYVADAGASRTGDRRTVEVWPYSTTSEQLSFAYWTAQPPLADDAELPPSIDAYVLKEGVLIDVYRFKMAQLGDAGKGDAATFWSNIMRSQETRWSTILMEAAAQQRALDDTVVWLRSATPTTGVGEIRTASDHVWSR